MKLVAGEPEETALRAELRRWDAHVASELLAVEVLRACARYGDDALGRATVALDSISLIPVDREVIRAAAALQPTELRSLDAIHLATALSLGDDLGVVVAYDRRLVAAARAEGLAVASPA